MRPSDRSLRLALRATALFNFAAAAAFAFPESAGRLLGLPDAPPVYAALCAVFIALFGASYAWLAAQPAISRPLLGLGAIGKALAFATFFLLWLTGEASLLLMLGGAGDLAFALYFAAWLRQARMAPLRG